MCLFHCIFVTTSDALVTTSDAPVTTSFLSWNPHSVVFEDTLFGLRLRRPFSQLLMAKRLDAVPVPCFRRSILLDALCVIGGEPTPGMEKRS